MPLFNNAIHLIKANLESIERGHRVSAVEVGVLTSQQLSVINQERASGERPLPEITGELIFIGSHIYDSRCRRDGYSIDDVISQISSAMDESGVVCASPKMTTIESSSLRNDGYGNQVRDKIILECTGKHPKAEIYSVIPKGDKIKPKKKTTDEDSLLSVQKLSLG